MTALVLWLKNIFRNLQNWEGKSASEKPQNYIQALRFMKKLLTRRYLPTCTKRSSITGFSKIFKKHQQE
jgi:hypothetical protein